MNLPGGRLAVLIAASISAAATLRSEPAEFRPLPLDRVGELLLSPSGTAAPEASPTPPAGDETETLRQSAEQGDPAAQTRLALNYQQGRGLDHDDVMAVHWVRKAAEQGYVPAQVLMAAFINAGIGRSLDNAQATEWLHQAAEHGDPLGQYLYAQSFFFRQPPDYTQAAEWLRQAADQGLPVAQGYLAAMYLAGTGVKKDLVQAYRWSQKGADAGDPRAQITLGEIFLGGVAVDPNEDAAMNWFRKAADQGDRVAQYNLARLLSRNRDEKEARDRFRQAARQGHLRAQLELAAQLETDHGGPPDFAAAARWYRQAALQGEAAGLAGLLPLLSQQYSSCLLWPGFPAYLAAGRAEAIAAGITDPAQIDRFTITYLAQNLPGDQTPPPAPAPTAEPDPKP